MTADAHILCRDLVRIFVTKGVEVQALQGLDLRVDPGEIVALVGASGSASRRCSRSSRGSTSPPRGRHASRGTTCSR